MAILPLRSRSSSCAGFLLALWWLMSTAVASADPLYCQRAIASGTARFAQIPTATPACGNGIIEPPTEVCEPTNLGCPALQACLDACTRCGLF